MFDEIKMTNLELKKYDLDLDKDEEELVKSIREIPFRIMAEKYGTDENSFMENVRKDKETSDFFLKSQASEKFREVSKNLLKLPLTGAMIQGKLNIIVYKKKF